jgi:maleate isomerase
VTSIALDQSSLNQFDLDRMLRAARLLADARMDVIAWNGTSGAWRGTADDDALCTAITDATSAASTTGTLAHFAALKQMGVQRYALAVPYTHDVAQAIVATYGAQGFVCTNVGWLGISHNAAFADVPPDAIRDLVKRADTQDAEAVVVICTNLGAGWLVDELESDLRKPVLDSAVVTVWRALRLAGVDQSLSGWGRLLQMKENPVERTRGRVSAPSGGRV